MRVYLAGAIMQSADAVWWRKNATLAMRLKGWDPVDPLMLELGNLPPRALVETDLAAIKTCDAVLARTHEPSWGTPMECFYAHGLGIPVVMWQACLSDPCSPWLLAHGNMFVETFADAMDALALLGKRKQ